MADEPIFISQDINAVLKEILEAYEAATGRNLLDGQPERLIFNAWAYREALLRRGIQDASLQNLVDFATAPILDYHGVLVGVTRLGAVTSKISVTFGLTVGHGDFTIPAGTRIGSTDGRAVFKTMEDIDVLTADVDAGGIVESEIAGAAYNGYNTGTLTIMLDTVAGVDSVTNNDDTNGGADIEDDETLRIRIKLAPNSFSTAGSRGAYDFWTRSANPSIVDVEITSPTPGTVEVFPLIYDPDDLSIGCSPVVKTEVENILTDERVRPITDTVIVTEPTGILVDVNRTVVLYDTAVQADVDDAIIANVSAFMDERRRLLGKDVTRVQLIAAMMQGLEDQVYNITLTDPAADVVVASGEFPYLGDNDTTSFTTTPG